MSKLAPDLLLFCTYVVEVAAVADYYTAYTSIDGTNWDRAETWRQNLGSNEKIALASMGGPQAHDIIQP